ncbi:MAG: hypothetical protein IJD67_00675 [Clostridia bacterium]|nr:hypothetical protein [Clostridia bacterium]
MYREYDAFEDSRLYKTMNEYRAKREARIAMATSAMLVFIGLALGVILYRIVGEDIDVDQDALIGTYFRGMLANASGFGEKLRVILDSFFHELAFPAFVFVLGYTVFAPIACAAICVWEAAVCGFAICMLEFTSVGGIFIESLLYLISRIAIISICVSVSLRAFFFSRAFNSDRVELKDVIKRQDARAYAIDFVISAGVLFVTVILTLVMMNFV